MTIKIILVAILLCSMIIPVGGFLLSKKKKGGFKAALVSNLFFFFGTIAVADILLFSGNVQAAEEVVGEVSANVDGWRYMAAALSTGLSCIGAGIAVASAASAALGALSEDSSIMGKALIFVALAESIALYGLLISFSILG
ncbi:MAG: ATP synthase subunit C [Lachnospiraceae bacterium]